eukprot:4477508-Pyramimonas_sp.AAC.1
MSGCTVRKGGYMIWLIAPVTRDSDIQEYALFPPGVESTLAVIGTGGPVKRSNINTRRPRALA